MNRHRALRTVGRGHQTQLAALVGVGEALLLVAGLDAELAGSLAHLLQALIDWWQTSTQDATPAQWAERGRALLAALFKPRDDNDRNALSALDQALTDWVRACGEAGFAEAVPLAVVKV